MGLKNVTVTLDNGTLAEARVRAAERNLSLSRYIGQVLREQVRRSDAYEDAMRRFFANRFVIDKKPGERWPTREETHERARLRRR